VITDVRLGDNELTIYGDVQVTVVYETEDNTFDSINLSAPFQCTAEGDYPEGIYQHLYQASVDEIDVKPLKNRKIETECLVSIAGFSVASISCDTIDTDYAQTDLQYRYEEVGHTVMKTASIEKEVRDSLYVGDDGSEIEVLSVNCYIADTDKNLSSVGILYNATIKGSVFCKLTDEEENFVYKSFPVEVPFNCFVERDDLASIDYYSINGDIIATAAQPDNEMEESYINLALTVCTNATMFQLSSASVLSDCYSFTQSARQLTNTISAFNISSYDTKTIHLNKEIILPEAAKFVCFQDVLLSCQEERYDNKVSLLGNADVLMSLMSYNTEESFYALREALDFSADIPLEADEDCYIDTQLSKIDIKQNSAEIALSIDVELTVFKYEPVSITLVQDVALEEYEADATDSFDIIVHYMQPNEELWDIAKKYLVPAEKILQDNNFDSEGDLQEYAPILIMRS
jgi:hypothetical protein